MNSVLRFRHILSHLFVQLLLLSSRYALVDEDIKSVVTKAIIII